MASASWLGSTTWVQQLADATGMPLLPGSIDTMLWSMVLFYATYAHLAELASTLVLGRKRWDSFSPATQKEWRMRTTNLLKGLIIGVYATYLVVAGVGGRSDRTELVDRMFRRDVAVERLGGFSVGFYVWHLGVLMQNFANEGVGNVAHHILVSTCMMSIYRPFLAHHLPCFLAYEVTNIPHNFYRMSKILGHARMATFHSAAWIVLFFLFRILYGTLASIAISQDFVQLWKQQQELLLPETKAWTAAQLALVEDQTLMIRPIPYWVIVWCLACTVFLASLNFTWFYKIARSTGARLCGKRKATTP
ncbi:TLC domain-containing protein [Microdochium trichocladiopsis]|uniref:TLC domain-containing protein n=1 Tax=Microdochium trichocladiopsis TaxID=1682393 RepID=A0A9P8YED1_9PEZI|nr:TLC domain-containing protein [Microdochium trichocladiopsis]KAH7037342.1 TLC domain-containing protein [Microdochium trichocladiopsis]